MFGVVLAILCGLGLVLLVRTYKQARPLAVPLLFGYALRLIIQSFVRDIPFFSFGVGGDYVLYEERAKIIIEMWKRSGIHFVTQSEFPELGATSLPPNIFALVDYLNDGSSRLGCTAIVALAAALTIFNLYMLARQFGAPERDALLVSCLLYFEPTFLFYTADVFKDGLVICLTIGALASAMRLTFRTSLLHATIGLMCLAGLWYVRFYLVFVTLAPFLVGIVGLGTRSMVRPVMAIMALVAMLFVLVGFTDILQSASERASQTFDFATNAALDANVSFGGASGVTFDDGGSPFGALIPKLAYTIFSPFPWALGSLGFQIGKIGAFLWYYLIYRAVRGARRVDRRLVLGILTFVVPCALAYAMTMANVGLIVRQRLVIVFATGILAFFGGARQTQTIVVPALALESRGEKSPS